MRTESQEVDTDPDCVHCVLAPHLHRFHVDHADRPVDIADGLTQLLAEYLIDTTPDADSASEAVLRTSRVLKEMTIDLISERYPTGQRIP